MKTRFLTTLAAAAALFLATACGDDAAPPSSDGGTHDSGVATDDPMDDEREDDDDSEDDDSDDSDDTDDDMEDDDDLDDSGDEPDDDDDTTDDMDAGSDDTDSSDAGSDDTDDDMEDDDDLEAAACVFSTDCPLDLCSIVGCVDGKCTYHAKVCNDGLSCTTDSCNPRTGACEFTDTCEDGLNCVLECGPEGSGCFEVACRPPPACLTASHCEEKPCQNIVGCIRGICTYEDKVCDDDLSCTTDSCDAGTGECIFASTCHDDVGCTADTCTTTGCSSTAR